MKPELRHLRQTHVHIVHNAFLLRTGHAPYGQGANCCWATVFTEHLAATCPATEYSPPQADRIWAWVYMVYYVYYIYFIYFTILYIIRSPYTPYSIYLRGSISRAGAGCKARPCPLLSNSSWLWQLSFMITLLTTVGASTVTTWCLG